MKVERNDFWVRIYPGEKATAAGYTSWGFETIKAANKFMDCLKREFPDDNHSLITTHKWWVGNRAFTTKSEAETYAARATEQNEDALATNF